MPRPIPGNGSRARALKRGGGGRPYVSLLQSRKHNSSRAGGLGIVRLRADRAASMCSSSRAGRSAATAAINLVSIGEHDRPSVRFPGSFGSGYLYYVVPKVILFRLEHSRRTLVPKVDFVSAPGTSPGNVYRTGGPIALVTNRCVFSFDKAKGRFRLDSVHPGHSVDEVRDETGFDFDLPARVGETPAPDAETLRLMRERVAPELAEVYPEFTAKVFNIRH
jgi:glutaconate CoA-transferase subunit B